MRLDDSVRHLVVQDLTAAPADDRLDWIRDDQRMRWDKGLRAPVEAYLDLAPLKHADDEFVLDLIYCEWMLRQEYGESPLMDEYLRRFPRLAASIQRLLALDYAFLGGSITGTRNGDSVDSVKAGAPGLTKIGKYPLVCVLAEGGQGVVYRALHPTLSKEVIIKWSKKCKQAAGERDQLIAEGQVLARMEHPGLVRVLDVDFHEDRPFLVMEAVAAVTLEQYRDRAHPDPRRSARLIAQIARALDAAHRLGVVHRDIKPKNVLVDERDQPRLIDFGLASWTHPFSETAVDVGSLSGTLAYMAPEQARADEASISPRTDVFGLGGVLYFLLTGRAPYRATEFRTLHQEAIQGAWDRKLLDETPMPDRLRVICARALASKPTERYASAQELADALDAMLLWPRRAVLGTAIVTMVILAIALGVWIRTLGPNGLDEPKRPGPSGQVEQLPPSKLTVEVVRKVNGKAFALEDAAPVVTGNLLRMSAELPAGRHGAFAHFSDGKWELLHSHAPESSPRIVAHPPEAGAQAPLGGNAGTEFFLFLARKERPIAAADLDALVPGMLAFPTIHEQAFFTLNALAVKKSDRGVLGKPVRGESPEDIAFRQLEKIRAALRPTYDVYAGVLFVHKGPDN